MSWLSDDYTIAALPAPTLAMADLLAMRDHVQREMAVAMAIPRHILVSPCLGRLYQFRFPRSRKQRIRRKWARDLRNWRTSDEAFQCGDKLIVSPGLMQRTKRETTAAEVRA